MVPQVVVFDLFGVLAHHQSPAVMRRMERLVEVPASALWRAYWSARPAYDAGRVSPEDYWREVAAELGVRLHRETVDLLRAEDVAGWAATDPEMTGLVVDLASRGLRLALLSNVPAELAEHHERTASWLSVFEGLFLSCRIGHAKPEPEAFAAVSDGLGVPPTDLLLVDDRADNVEAAARAGWGGHVFTGRADLEVALASVLP